MFHNIEARAGESLFEEQLIHQTAVHKVGIRLNADHKPDS